MDPKDFMEDSTEHATKEWLRMRIQYDQAQSALGVLQGENDRVKTKFGKKYPVLWRSFF